MRVGHKSQSQTGIFRGLLPPPSEVKKIVLIFNVGNFYAKIWCYFLPVFGAMTSEKSGKPKSMGGGHVPLCPIAGDASVRI